MNLHPLPICRHLPKSVFGIPVVRDIEDLPRFARIAAQGNLAWFQEHGATVNGMFLWLIRPAQRRIVRCLRKHPPEDTKPCP